jgi:hypothetical protein
MREMHIYEAHMRSVDMRHIHMRMKHKAFHRRHSGIARYSVSCRTKGCAMSSHKRLQIAARQAAGATRGHTSVAPEEKKDFFLFAGLLEAPTSGGGADAESDRRLEIRLYSAQKNQPLSADAIVFNEPPRYRQYHEDGPMSDGPLSYSLEMIDYKLGGIESLVCTKGEGVARPTRLPALPGRTMYAIAGMLKLSPGAKIPELCDGVLLFEEDGHHEVFAAGDNHPLRNGEPLNNAWCAPVWLDRDRKPFGIWGTPLPLRQLADIEDLRRLEARERDLTREEAVRLAELRRFVGEFSLDPAAAARSRKHPEFEVFLRRMDEIFPGERAHLNAMMRPEDVARRDEAAAQIVADMAKEKEMAEEASPKPGF